MTGTGQTTLPKVPLGFDGPRVGVQGLGCMGMSWAYGPTDDNEARATLEAALELGVTMFDTADIYGGGANEEFLSPFVRAHRDEVFLATKFGVVRQEGDRFAVPRIRGDRGYLRSAVEGSLQRLGVEVIDLYYCHRLDTSRPIEEIVSSMAELVAEGKVRQLGLSEVTGRELRAAHAVHPITALQSEWSLFSRDVERTAVPAAKELGVAVVPYSPLGRGFLTGAFADANKDLGEDDFRRSQPRFTGENARANAALLEPVQRIAAAHGMTPAQVALAWVQQRADAHGIAVVPIPGTRRRSRLRENVAAATMRLTPQELASLEPIADQVSGDRYADMAGTSSSRED